MYNEKMHGDHHKKRFACIMMISRSSLSSILIILYLVTSVYYLYLSSLPIEPCTNGIDGSNDGSSCIKPLLYYHQQQQQQSKNDLIHESTFVLELHVPSITNETFHNKKDRSRPQLTWKKLSSCFTTTSTTTKTEASNDNEEEKQMSFEIDEFLEKEFQTQNTDSIFKYFFSFSKSPSKKKPTIRHQCKLSFPNHFRIRNPNRKLVTPFKGKFILKQVIQFKDNHQKDWKETNFTIAETIFDLTRIVQKPMKQRSNKQQEHVPHFKYYKQSLVLRVVTDTHDYPIHNPLRGDGYKMNYFSSDQNQLLLSQVHHYNQSYYFYRPIFYVDDVALRHNSQIELGPPPTTKDDEIKPPVTLNIKLSFMTPMRHIIQRQIELSLYMAGQLFRPNELDELRYLISDEYMYKFIITQIIGFIHLTLDYLAFKNEIGFYVGRGKDVTGISLSSLYSRCICDIIIFLYLVEGDNTSWFVLFSIGSSVMVELWKLYKFLQPKLNLRGFPNIISFRDLSSMSSTEQMTIDYDSVARTYLSLILYPLVLGMALYGRQFYTYASWYSWVISNLANAVYTFGFISLCPQLYINYKLKSVAHLPWRVFLYKIFNTFVDDVFAFIIEMPLKHKIMTLRDDVVFFIFLIQAYIYRVDKKRANEYGYAYENENEKQKERAIDEITGNNDHIKLD